MISKKLRFELFLIALSAFMVGTALLRVGDFVGKLILMYWIL